jgi:hypothetical protein
MRYQRTQVYLDPEDHRKLKEEAHRRGISLAELMRQLAHAHVSERAPAYGEKSWDAIIAIDTSEEPSDIGRYEEEYKREMWLAKAVAMEEDHRRQAEERKSEET